MAAGSVVGAKVAGGAGVKVGAGVRVGGGGSAEEKQADSIKARTIAKIWISALFRNDLFDVIFRNLCNRNSIQNSIL